MRAGLLAAAGVAAIALSGVARAQDDASGTAAAAPAGPVVNLRDALVKTYGTNPTIMAERHRCASRWGRRFARAPGRPKSRPRSGSTETS